MTVHYWGDKDFDWEALDKAMDFIYKFCLKAGKFRPVMKEKYGTIRYEFVSTWIMYEHDGLETWESVSEDVQKKRKKIFDQALIRAAKRWPHVEEEIWEDYPFETL